MKKLKKIIAFVLIVACMSLVLSSCVACVILLSTPMERPEGYLHVYLNINRASIECYLSPEDYNRWLDGDTGVVTAVPYNPGDDEIKVNIATIVTIQ